MIIAIGDSHALYTFIDNPEVKTYNRNGLTMKRVGYAEDETIPNMLKELLIHEEDYIIFCLGEIDIRYFVKQYLEHHSSANLNKLLMGWVERYLDTISKYGIYWPKIIIMSVVPPTKEASYVKYNLSPKKLPFSNKKNAVIPWAGTDAERALYTKTINDMLNMKVKGYGWKYLDIYSMIVDNDGMLLDEYSDETVHVANCGETINKLLKEMI